MRGCAVSLLIGLLSLALTMGVGILLFHFYVGLAWREAALPGAVVGGLLWMAFNFFRAAAHSLREKRAAEAGLAGGAPADGEMAVLVGTLEPLGGTLKAPLDGSDCVAYSYSISQRVGQGKRARTLTHYQGAAVVPAVLRTATGSYGLMAVPDFEGEPQLETKGEPNAAAERYIASTTFQASGPHSTNELTERWNDADGEYRSDISTVTDEKPDLLDCLLTQHRVQAGERVCLIGAYSAAKNAIVPHANWGKRTRLIVGDAADVAATLRGQVRMRAFLGLLFATGAVFAAWQFIVELG
jgi:hypothetical protein